VNTGTFADSNHRSGNLARLSAFSEGKDSYAWATLVLGKPFALPDLKIYGEDTIGQRAAGDLVRIGLEPLRRRNGMGSRAGAGENDCKPQETEKAASLTDNSKYNLSTHDHAPAFTFRTIMTQDGP
jgi:hypothetical protein